MLDTSYFGKYGWIKHNSLELFRGLFTYFLQIAQSNDLFPQAHSIKYVFTNPNLYKKNKLYPNKLFKKYLFINTSLTILLSIPPIFPLDENHAYALAGSWCWIRGNTEYDNIVRIVSQYAVQILCGVYIIFVYWYFLRKLFMRTANISEQRGRLMNETIGRLKWFPIVYFICYIPQIINRIYQIAFNDENYVLTVVHFGALAVSGLLDALIYSWTKPVKALYKKIWSSWTHDREHHNSLNIIWALYSELDDDDDDDSHIQETKTLKKTTGTKTAISGITTAPSTMPSTSKLSINNCT